MTDGKCAEQQQNLCTVIARSCEILRKKRKVWFTKNYFVWLNNAKKPREYGQTSDLLKVKLVKLSEVFLTFPGHALFPSSLESPIFFHMLDTKTHFKWWPRTADSLCQDFVHWRQLQQCVSTCYRSWQKHVVDICICICIYICICICIRICICICIKTSSGEDSCSVCADLLPASRSWKMHFVRQLSSYDWPILSRHVLWLANFVHTYPVTC